MDIYQRTALYHVMKNPDNGVSAKGLGELDTTIPGWQRNGLPAPKYKTLHEEILVGKYGTSLGTREKWSFGTTRTQKDLVAGRYNSETIARLIKEAKLPNTEDEIISKINVVSTECDLRKTVATALPDLKEVGGTLTLDTASSLSSLGGLKKAGKINVFAKNLKEMDEYLIKLGILSKDGKKFLVEVADDIYLIMKNYL